MRYDKTWLENRLDSIHQMAPPDSLFKELTFAGSAKFGYAIRLPMGGGITEVKRGTLKECLAYLDGILFTLQTFKHEQQ